MIRSILLFSLLLLVTLNNSFLGTLDLVDFSLPLIIVVLINIFINFNFHPKALLLFLITLLTIFLSIIVNYQNLHQGGYNSAIFTIVLLTLFSINLKKINFSLFKKLLFIYLSIVSFLGVYFWVNSIYFSDFFISRDGQFFAGGKMAISFFLNPNRAGAFFVLCFFLSLFFVDSKFWKYSLMLVNLFLVVFSYSRGSMLALIIGGLYYFSVRSNNIFSILKFYSFTTLSFIAAIFSMLIWFPDEIKGVFYKLTSFGASNRFYLWETVLKDSVSSPQRFLFGSGPSTTSVNVLSSHNSFINEFSNLGILFLIAILFYLFNLILDAKKEKNFSFLPFLLVTLVIGTFESMLFVDPTMIWVGLILIKLLSFMNKELINT